ncbi:SprT-like family-domain-containing protein [Plectosphaerella plurivora]|uniref:SprT-like family-domain-containing protein n=1 Tax=Plectosphaerella plurivora TaxID=936078 RepID=A0A9P8V3L5_9PEZI|nr:SprT-like family-domain-containing protein [Plectosphaerella plurivora]
MAIDWASSSEDEFPDLDEVLARAKANKLKTTQTAPVPSRRGASRSTVSQSQSRRRKTPVSDNEDSEQPSPDREEVSTRTVVRRRKLGPLTDSIFSKPIAPAERKEKGRSDGLLEKGSKLEPKIKIRPLRATKSTSTAPGARERAPANSHEDEIDSSDDMSDFIVNTDDESDAYSETSSQPKLIKSLPAMQPSGSTQPAREATRSVTPEKKDRKPTSTQILPAARTEPRRKLIVPPDSLADALGRLDISTSSAPERQQTPPNTPPRATTSKKTLVSPKKLPRVPKTPHRPSMDLFWDQEFFNEWNEEHSPRKLFLPQVSKTPAKSPAKEEKTKVVAERTAKKLFESHKHQLAESFFRELDETITEGQIAKLAASAGGVKIQWSKTLNTTAGRANWKKETIRSAPGQQRQDPPRIKHHAAIELAEKVISDDHRLLNVLAHEFCHLANFMITGITTNPHGKEFKAWAAKVSRAFADRDIEVTTKHSYEIDFKYIWTCGECALEYKRHSKSINTERHRCGKCKGTLLQTRPIPRGAGRTVAAGTGAGEVNGRDKAPAAKKEPTEYQRFVKEQMRIVREENPGSPQKDMMRLVADKWSKTKGAKASRSGSREASVESVVAQLDDLVL